MYAYRPQDQVIKLFYELPRTWKNISNFNNLSDQEARQYGFYPVEEVRDTYDPRTQRPLDEPEFSFNGDVVIRRWRAVDLTQEEIEALQKRVLRQEINVNLEVVAEIVSEVFGKLVSQGLLDPQDLNPDTIQKFATLQARIKNPDLPTPPTNPGNPTG